MTDTIAAPSPAVADRSEVPQSRHVGTAIPGPNSVAMHERRMRVVPKGVGEMVSSSADAGDARRVLSPPQKPISSIGS